MGDEVQAIKAGLLEVADIVVVNKGDRPGAQRTAAALRAMQTAAANPRLRGPLDAGDAGRGPGRREPRPEPRRPEVLLTTATSGDGVPELVAAIDRHRAGLGDAGDGISVRRARAAALVWALVGDRVRGRLLAPDLATATTAAFDAVVRHELDPYAAADRLLASLTHPGADPEP
jgi:LAO/AO transport system kinase